MQSHNRFEFVCEPTHSWVAHHKIDIMASIETHVHLLFVSHASYYHSRPCDTPPQSYSLHTVPFAICSWVQLQCCHWQDAILWACEYEYSQCSSHCFGILLDPFFFFFFVPLSEFILLHFFNKRWLSLLVGSISDYSISRVRARLVRLLNKFYCYYAKSV